jgi:probable HAF family extracellular repeat protein
MSSRNCLADVRPHIGLKSFIQPCRASGSDCRRRSIVILILLSLAALPSADAYPQKSTASYTFTDLGGLPGLSYIQSEALAINDYGEIVGWSYTADQNGGMVKHAVVWAKDATGRYVITDLGPGIATGINDEGEVITDNSLIVPVSINGSLVWYQDLNGDGINDLANAHVAGNAINNHAQISDGYDVIQFDAAGNEIITTLPGGGYAINDYGEVAGEAPNGSPEAAVWEVDTAGNVVSTELLDPLAGSAWATATCIDQAGNAAGYSDFLVSTNPPAGRGRATLWMNGGPPIDLGAPSNSDSEAKGMSIVNGVLQVVGYAGDYAFLWKNGVMKNLNTLSSASGVTLSEATAISSNGQIVGTAHIKTGKYGYQIHAFLFTPK